MTLAFPSRPIPYAVRRIWEAGPATRELPVTQPRSVGCRLEAHLRSWLGVWPPRADLELVVWPGRDEPGWDGGVWPGVGIESPRGVVLSLAPSVAPDPSALDADRVLAALRGPDATAAAPAAFERPDLRLSCAVFRWTAAPTTLPIVGEWVDQGDPRLPPWLRPFNGGVLAAWDGRGRLAAAVGIKRHNAHGHEIAVGTEPAHRGKGLARALVAQAARRILANNAVPLYLHDHDNAASARTAEAAGFPDAGWRVFGLLPEVHPRR